MEGKAEQMQIEENGLIEDGVCGRLMTWCHQECLLVCKSTGNMDKVQMKKTPHLMKMCIRQVSKSANQLSSSSEEKQSARLMIDRFEGLTGRVGIPVDEPGNGVGW